jgi:chromosome segregation ATPase
MKHLIPASFILCICIIFNSCENFKTQYESASRRADSLNMASDLKDSSINTFIASLNEIETNLDTIAHKQGSIEQTTSLSGEAKADQKARINESISIINELLDRNRELLSQMQKKVRSQGHKLSELQKLVDNLNVKISEKDTELVMLNYQLADMKMNVENLNVTIDTLTSQNVSKEGQIKEKTEKLHSAYYIVGTYKELRDKKVVNKEGGFLGIGKNQKLINDFNGDAFTKIDITQTASLELNCKDAKIITTHPMNSYSLEKDKDKVKSLTITDYEKFWGVSKYLVIVKN